MATPLVRRTMAACLGLLVAALPVLAATKADPVEFYRRIESIGLKTGQLKKVASKISLVYWEPNADAEAQYGYIRNQMWLPAAFKEEKSNRIRFNLEPHEICTVVHEWTHAEYDVTASEKAKAGTPDREHWQAVEWIWADITLDSRHQTFGLARYPRFKADEVAGYYMGDAAYRLFDAANDIVLYNTVFFNKNMNDPDAVEALGDKLVLPPAASESPIDQRLLKVKFGQKYNSFEAYFEGKKIAWDQQSHVLAHLYKHALGLQPPAEIAELLDRMNAQDNAWMRGVRAKVLAARQAHVKKLREPPATRSADPLDGSGELNER